MTSTTVTTAERIRALNDAFRRPFVGGMVMITAGVEALPAEQRRSLLQKVRAFDAFISESEALAVASRDGILVPRVIAAAGDQAARRFHEFFAATIRNKNTRMAYCRAAELFFAWCDHHKIGEIADIEPLHVAAYVEAMGKDFEKPTVK
jgi:hypothetical protein